MMLVKYLLLYLLFRKVYKYLHVIGEHNIMWLGFGRIQLELNSDRVANLVATLILSWNLDQLRTKMYYNAIVYMPLFL